jgi:DNA-binding MarR family transcriptional regulator
MDSSQFRLLHLLEMLADDQNRSQRDLSRSLDISLGLVNAFIRQLVNDGYCTVKSLPSKRLRYMLTPSGMIKKTMLVYEYISTSYSQYRNASNRLNQFFRELEDEGIERIVFCGTGELCDIATLVLPDTKLQLVAVVDQRPSDENQSRTTVKPLSRLLLKDYDVILITARNDHANLVESIHDSGISEKRIRFIE